ncbi:venom carboxylesterase-6-like [Homarus americanus]|uniref:venom carboxylesterase-6-like n=1 Tax=Homarus americanus TaxID=6706 RepID=UPI001C4661CB|nr:venom carboxylesterase-6-like [Homarus americanus]
MTWEVCRLWVGCGKWVGWRIWAVVWVMAWTVALAQNEVTLEVRLKQGTIIGLREETGVANKYFYSFLGIPFAQPPVDGLRFRDPVPAGGWRGTKDGRVVSPACPQLEFNAFLEGEVKVLGQEDCLYLNVYTPHPLHPGLPVMVWIHGGAFILGAAHHYSPLPFLTKDIVLVTIQYRLGTLGFLSTEDSTLPGNLGLKDQTLALRWVQDNIRDLGGDPNKVTIFGQSAGAASVHLQVLSPHARGLFQRAILQSGSSLSPWATRADHRQVATTIGQAFNCSGVKTTPQGLNSRALLYCLQTLPLEDLVAIPSAFAVWLNTPMVMTPRVDGDFLPDHPARLLRSNRYNKVDLISGVTQHEGALAALPILTSREVQEALTQDFGEIGPVAVNFEDEDAGLSLARRVFKYYLGDLNITEASAKELVELFGDRWFNVPHEETTSLHSRDTVLGKNVVAYALVHRGEHSLADVYNSPLALTWVSHADDLQYLFDGAASLPPLQRPQDLELRQLMLTMWTNFAATGNPTPDKTLGVRWVSSSPDRLSYLALRPNLTMLPDTRAQVRKFWSSLPTRQNRILYTKQLRPSQQQPPRTNKPSRRDFINWFRRRYPNLRYPPSHHHHHHYRGEGVWI